MAGNGAESFRALARDFQKAGTTGLRRRLYAALYRSARPATDAAKASALSTLPKGGGRGKRRTRLVTTGTVTVDGNDYVVRRRRAMKTLSDGESLAQRVAGARYGVKAIGGREPAVRITATAKGKKSVDLNRLDQGVVRHPLFGNRGHWYAQRVPPAWFSRPVMQQADNVRAQLEKAVADLERDISSP